MSSAAPAAPRTSAYGRPLIQLSREIDKHIATLHRWRDPGVLDPSGVRRRLIMTRVGGRWYVKNDDLSAFFAALAATEGDQPTPAVRTRSDDDERNARELDSIGIR